MLFFFVLLILIVKCDLEIIDFLANATEKAPPVNVSIPFTVPPAFLKMGGRDRLQMLSTSVDIEDRYGPSTTFFSTSMASISAKGDTLTVEPSPGSREILPDNCLAPSMADIGGGKTLILCSMFNLYGYYSPPSFSVPLMAFVVKKDALGRFFLTGPGVEVGNFNIYSLLLGLYFHNGGGDGPLAVLGPRRAVVVYPADGGIVQDILDVSGDQPFSRYPRLPVADFNYTDTIGTIFALPDVAKISDTHYAVVWTDLVVEYPSVNLEVKARVFNAMTYEPASDVFVVSPRTVANQQFVLVPTVFGRDGTFVVSWSHIPANDTGRMDPSYSGLPIPSIEYYEMCLNDTGVFVRALHFANGAIRPLGDAFLANTGDVEGCQIGGHVAHFPGTNSFVASWTEFDGIGSGEPTLSVMANSFRFGSGGITARGAVPVTLASFPNTTVDVRPVVTATRYNRAVVALGNFEMGVDLVLVGDRSIPAASSSASEFSLIF